MPKFLAFDIGTSAGRVMLGSLSVEGLALEILHRFPNRPVPVRGTLYWDILYLWHEVLFGLRQWRNRGEPDLDGIGLDTWGVDFALLDESGALLDNPVHNRDARTDGMMERVFQKVPREEVYARTGIQFMQVNTLYQLYAMVLADAPALRHAATFLTTADVLNYWLTGRQVVEFTSATCTQFYDPTTGEWARDLLARLDIPVAMLPEVVPPGTVLGPLNLSVSELADLSPIPVIAVATHDTASAVAAVPAETQPFAYISSGTWSLMGAEVRSPVITAESLRYNFTNEGGVNGTYRLLKNILGMWLIQACQDVWAGEGQTFTFSELVDMAAAAPPLGPVIDPHPNSPDFRTAENMPARIRAFCARTGQPVPQDEGRLLRCVFESLALKYRQTLEQLEIVLGHTVEVIHIVGGGARNELLCQMTAEATNRLVIAGPSEATTMGNLAVQAIATGHLASLEEARALIRRSSPLKRYEPTLSRGWDDAYARFVDIAQV
ncbi:MAG TPA: rhamnulokinase family protein [Aggregatilineaceae bacterium]|nr:rhamnulokinase family protein [Aggregatilineaceae bacterium]